MENVIKKKILCIVIFYTLLPSHMQAKQSFYKHKEKKYYFGISLGAGEAKLTDVVFLNGPKRRHTSAQIIAGANLGYWFIPDSIGGDISYWHYPSLKGVTKFWIGDYTVNNDNLVAASIKLKSRVENKLNAYLKLGLALTWPEVVCKSWVPNCRVIINGLTWTEGRYRQVTVLGQIGMGYALTYDLNLGAGVNYSQGFGPLPTVYSAVINLTKTF